MDEGFGFGLEFRGGGRGVGRRYGVQERPAATAEGDDVGGAVGGWFRGEGGFAGGGGFAHCEPGRYVGAGAASGEQC